MQKTLIILAVILFTVTASVGTVSAQAKQPRSADFNKDGVVNIFDLSILLSDYGKHRKDALNKKTDLNRDKVINIFDLSILLSQYNKVAPATETEEL